jgi:hypothetical protein
MLTHAGAYCVPDEPDECGSTAGEPYLLTYASAAVCCRMLTYADVYCVPDEYGSTAGESRAGTSGAIC